jgi:NaMN:DMB phosphoribosyltransferase
MNWWLESVKQPNLDAKQQAEQHQLQLTKPTGALGDLEQIAITLASLQSNAHPHVKPSMDHNFCRRSWRG